jgi:hypothetical protein
MTFGEKCLSRLERPTVVLYCIENVPPNKPRHETNETTKDKRRTDWSQCHQHTMLCMPMPFVKLYDEKYTTIKNMMDDTSK